MRYPYFPQQQESDPWATGLGLLGTILGQGYAQRGEDKRDKAILDTKTDVNNMQLQNPNDTIDTAYTGIKQGVSQPNAILPDSAFKDGRGVDPLFQAEMDPTNTGLWKNIQDVRTATGNNGWSPFKQVNPAQYKTDMQAVVDNNGNNGQGLLSGMQGIAQKYGNGGTFGNDVQYLANQTGDTTLMDATKTQQQPQLNEKPTVAITPQYIKSQIYSKQGEILQKLHSQGVDLKTAMPMVKQMLDERITDLTAGQADKELQSEYGNVQGALQADFNNPTARKNAIQAMMQYNQKAHNWGKNVLDVGMIDKLMATGMVKMSQIKVADPNTGETKIQDILVPINGGTMPDGSAYQTIGEPRSEGISPTTIYSQQQQNARTQANVDAKVTGRSGGGGGRGTSGRGSSGSGVTESQYKSAITQRDRFTKWQQDNPEKDSSEYPYWGQLDYANGVIDRHDNSGNTDNGNNDGGQDTINNDNSNGAAWYDQQVRAVMAGKGVDQATAEEIVSAHIRANGG